MDGREPVSKQALGSGVATDVDPVVSPRASAGSAVVLADHARRHACGEDGQGGRALSTWPGRDNARRRRPAGPGTARSVTRSREGGARAGVCAAGPVLADGCRLRRRRGGPEAGCAWPSYLQHVTCWTSDLYAFRGAQNAALAGSLRPTWKHWRQVATPAFPVLLPVLEETEQRHASVAVLDM